MIHDTAQGQTQFDLCAELQAQVAALTKERDWLNHKSKCLEMERASQEEYLAASQAREAKLREALEHYRNMASPRS